MENEEKPPREKHTNNNNAKRKRSSSNSNSRGQKKSLDCLLHGKNCGHSTDQCFVLKKQAEKLKSSTRSSQEHNYSDLHTFIKSEIRKANKPRKRSKKAPSNDLQAEQLSISDSSSIHDTESHICGEDIYASDTEWNEGSDETIDNMLNNSVYSDFNNRHLINKRLNKERKTSKISKQLFTTLD